jgi:hypothetical protein
MIHIKQATQQDFAKILLLFGQFFKEDGCDIALYNLPTAIAAMLNDPDCVVDCGDIRGSSNPKLDGLLPKARLSTQPPSDPVLSL